MKPEVIKFKVFGDDRGSLVSLESFKNVPFEIRRVYYIFGTKKEARRGYHCHKNLKQILVCVSGSCCIHLDNGIESFEVNLNKPDEGLYLGPNVWREMYNFSKDCVLMVLASELYSESDYIRDYQKFIDYIKKEKKNEN